ncbi:MAG: patatin-like phospholipase family protein [Holosporales bacterium]|nr:patatin-like phospholipase family protein [Holosporales bacterium]
MTFTASLLLSCLWISNSLASTTDIMEEERPAGPDQSLFARPEGESSLLSGLKTAENIEFLSEEEQQGIAKGFTVTFMKDKSRKPLRVDDGDVYTNLLAKHNVPLTYLTGLSIDGGGTRGVISAVLLEELQKYLTKPLHHYFDYIGGTSIGGIIALGLTAQDPENPTYPLLNASRIVSLFDQSERIFPKDKGKVERAPYNLPLRLWDSLRYLMTEAKATMISRYVPHDLMELLKENLREDTYFHTSLTHTLITAVDTKPQRPQTYLFDSRDARKLHEREEVTIPLWEIGRSTSAAPTYFPAYSLKLECKDGRILNEHQLIDGGLWLNNPTGLVARSLLKWASEEFMYASHKNMVMLSLGTGYAEEEKQLPSNAGWARAASPVIDTLMSVSSFSVHETMLEVIGRKNYARINPKISHKIDLDDTDEDNREILKKLARDKVPELEKFIQGPFRKILEADEFRLEPLRDQVEGQVEYVKGKERQIS